MAMEVSHIWLGRFPTREFFLDYFKEHYAGDDDTPVNKFAEDQGSVFYDTDWDERFYSDSEDLRELISQGSYSSDYVDQVIQDAESRGVESPNVFVIADKNEFPYPKSVTGENYELWYMGEYKCNV